MRNIKHILSNGTVTVLVILAALAVPGCVNHETNRPEQKPFVTVTDSQFKIRGFHIDLRIQVMTIEALKSFVDDLSSFGINTLVMEWEATYPFRNNAIISNEFSYTSDEITEFISYCGSKGIDVIPLQQCFGHVEYILRNDRYAKLREDRKDISQICPLKMPDDSLLFSDLFKELAETHPSKYIHIGGDETYLLGHCSECSQKVLKEGKSKLFVDYMKTMCDIVVGMGKTPVMWADILLRHPEAAGELPPQTIFIDWNYGWRNDLFGDISKIQQMGFTVWGAPAVRSHPDNYYVTCWEKHFNNQRDFIPYARNAGYEGIIMTSWSTSGLYGFTWDSNYEVVDMEQIRNTYPLSGFRILLASYAEALYSKQPINPHDFVISYAQERFGLTPEEGEDLWRSLMLSPELIVNGKPERSPAISSMKDSTEYAIKLLKPISPLRNKNEFEHFRLMLDLRKQYLAFKEIDDECNSPLFTTDDKEREIKKLKAVISESEQLDRRFAKLNKGFLYDSEIRKQNAIRSREMTVLYNKLRGNRN